MPEQNFLFRRFPLIAAIGLVVLSVGGMRGPASSAIKIANRQPPHRQTATLLRQSSRAA